MFGIVECLVLLIIDCIYACDGFIYLELEHDCIEPLLLSRSFKASFFVLLMKFLCRSSNNRLRLVFSRYFCSNERWADIDGFSMYQVSNWGNVRNIKHNKPMLINIERYKTLKMRPQVKLKSETGKYIALGISRLVLSTLNLTLNLTLYTQFILIRMHTIINFQICNGA